jgi:tetraacyldisaccharide 4'-kinase
MQKHRLTIGTIVLFPLTFIYWIIVTIRNYLFDIGVIPGEEFNLPIISVGNITVGGTGKTPHIEYLVELLKEEFSLATLSRGYGRSTRHFIIADMDSTSRIIGDESRQLKQKYPGMIVAVDRKRANGIKHLLKVQDPLDIILLDDAYQHRYVKPGKSVLLIDYNRMINQDFLLPSGRLREPVSERKRADIILITKSPERIKPIEMRDIVKNMKLELHQHLFFTYIEYGELHPVFNIENPISSSQFKQDKFRILILTGIANPRAIRKYARSISTNIREITFPDHHYYTNKDLDKIKNKLAGLNHTHVFILTTEKDAMRLLDVNVDDELKKLLYYIPIRVKFLENQHEEFNKLILNYVRSNKRNNILHKEPN